jgi:hypothetical protein
MPKIYGLTVCNMYRALDHFNAENYVRKITNSVSLNYKLVDRVQSLLSSFSIYIIAFIFR